MTSGGEQAEIQFYILVLVRNVFQVREVLYAGTIFRTLKLFKTLL